MDAELKRRDKSLENAFKQRDEEWRDNVKPGKIINFQKGQNDNNNNKLPKWFREA